MVLSAAQSNSGVADSVREFSRVNNLDKLRQPCGAFLMIPNSDEEDEGAPCAC